MPDIQIYRILQKNQYNNSNDSSNESKSFYDIVKDSPLIKKDSNINNSSENIFQSSKRREKNISKIIYGWNGIEPK